MLSKSLLLTRKIYLFPSFPMILVRKGITTTETTNFTVRGFVFLKLEEKAPGFYAWLMKFIWNPLKESPPLHILNEWGNSMPLYLLFMGWSASYHLHPRSPHPSEGYNHQRGTRGARSLKCRVRGQDEITLKVNDLVKSLTWWTRPCTTVLRPKNYINHLESFRVKMSRKVHDVQWIAKYRLLCLFIFHEVLGVRI